MKRRHVIVITARVALFIGVLAAWQYLSGNPSNGGLALIDEFFVSKPTDIADQFWSLLRDGGLIGHAWVTLQEALIGFAIGCSMGIVVGLILGVNNFVARVMNPFISALYSVPRLALTPLFILWFGIGMESKIALVVTLVFFLVFYNTYSGARQVDRELRDVLRVMGATSAQLHLRVTVPSAMTWVIAGFRLSVPYAFVAAVVGEMIASTEGLGYLIGRGGGTFSSATIFAAIAVVVAMSLSLNGIVSLVDRRVSRWRVSDTDAVGAPL